MSNARDSEYPGIFSVPDISYSINLMWVNEQPRPEHTFIAEDAQFESITSSVTKWMEGNSTAQINIWYDSKKLSNPPLQVESSIKQLQQSCLKKLGKNADKVEFKDIHRGGSTANL